MPKATLLSEFKELFTAIKLQAKVEDAGEDECSAWEATEVVSIDDGALYAAKFDREGEWGSARSDAVEHDHPGDVCFIVYWYTDEGEPQEHLHTIAIDAVLREAAKLTVERRALEWGDVKSDQAEAAYLTEEDHRMGRA